jgi:hypothetical protein
VTRRLLALVVLGLSLEVMGCATAAGQVFSQLACLAAGSVANAVSFGGSARAAAECSDPVQQPQGVQPAVQPAPDPCRTCLQSKCGDASRACLTDTTMATSADGTVLPLCYCTVYCQSFGHTEDECASASWCGAPPDPLADQELGCILHNCASACPGFQPEAAP